MPGCKCVCYVTCAATQTLQAELAEHATAVRQQQQATTQLENQAAAAKAELDTLVAHTTQQRSEQVGIVLCFVIKTQIHTASHHSFPCVAHHCSRKPIPCAAHHCLRNLIFLLSFMTEFISGFSY